MEWIWKRGVGVGTTERQSAQAYGIGLGMGWYTLIGELKGRRNAQSHRYSILIKARKQESKKKCRY
jgi:hypothetical protein